MSDEPTRCRRFGDGVETPFVRDENATRRTTSIHERFVLARTCDTCKREFKGRYAAGHDEAHGEKPHLRSVSWRNFVQKFGQRLETKARKREL